MSEEERMKEKGVEISAMQAGKRIEAVVSDALKEKIPRVMICLALEYVKTRLLTGNASISMPTEYVGIYDQIAHQVDSWISRGGSTWPMIVVISALIAENQPTYKELVKELFITKLNAEKEE